MAKYFISKGANYWKKSLQIASVKNNLEMADLIIQKIFEENKQKEFNHIFSLLSLQTREIPLKLLFLSSFSLQESYTKGKCNKIYNFIYPLYYRYNLDFVSKYLPPSFVRGTLFSFLVCAKIVHYQKYFPKQILLEIIKKLIWIQFKFDHYTNKVDKKKK